MERDRRHADIHLVGPPFSSLANIVAGVSHNHECKGEWVFTEVDPVWLQTAHGPLGSIKFYCNNDTKGTVQLRMV